MILDSVKYAFDELAKENHFENVEKTTLMPIYHVRESLKRDKNKKLLTYFTDAFNYWLDVPTDKLKLINEISEDVFDSLILFFKRDMNISRVDDITDNCSSRCGVPAANEIYGLKFALSSATQFLVTSLGKTTTFNHPDATKLYVCHIGKALRGRTMEGYWSHKGVCFEEHEYIDIVFHKIGDFNLVSVNCMQLFTKYKGDFTRLVRLVSLYYQIVNDLNNLFSEADDEGSEAFVDDITRGRYSFPIVHAIHKEKPNSKILNIVNQQTTDPDKKRYCFDLIKQMGSLDYTERVLEELEEFIVAEVGQFEPNPVFDKYFNELKNYKGKTHKKE